MLTIYFGDPERLDLTSSLFCSYLNNSNLQIVSSSTLEIVDLFDNYFQGDLFSLDPDNIIAIVQKGINCKNTLLLKSIKKSKKNVYIFYYGEKINKNSKFYKEIPSSNFIELKSIHDGFGGINEQELGVVKNEVLEYCKNLYANLHFPGGDLEYLILNLLKSSHYGGILNDIQSWIDIYEAYGENVREEVDCLTDSLDEYFLMSITNAIQNMDVEKIFTYIHHEKIEYISILVVLQNMFYNLDRSIEGFRDENFSINFTELEYRVPGVNKYSIYRSLKYVNKMGTRRIKYIYNYLNRMLDLECSNVFTYGREVKLNDLGRVVSGGDSLLI